MDRWVFDWDLEPRTTYDAKMSEFRCTECGHLMPGSEVAAHARSHDSNVDLIVDLSTDPQETTVVKGPESESTFNWATAALAAVVVAIVGWAVFGGGSEAESEAEEAAQIDEAAETELGADETRADNLLNNESIALGFSDLIDGEQQFLVVYPSADGLQMLSAAGPTTPEISVAFGFEQMARFPLISDGSRTWAVDPEDPTISYLVSTQFEVVDTSIEGRVAFIDTSRDPIRVGISSFGGWGEGFEVPDSSQILAVPGRGLLIMPQTGGTFIVTATGVDPVSDDSAVAASKGAEVYQRCDEALACELYVTNPGMPNGLKLDLPVGSEISISPSGRFVASINRDDTNDLSAGADGDNGEGAPDEVADGQGDPGEEDSGVGDMVLVFDTEDGSSWGIRSDQIYGLGWAPDESFVAITTGSELLVAATGRDRTTFGLPLPIDPTSGNVLVVSTPA